MELALARYRLLFTHPFGTAHGLRDGTDSVFVRLTAAGKVGYGEATLPPYLKETQLSVYDEIAYFWLKHRENIGRTGLKAEMINELSAPARAAIQMAHEQLTHNGLVYHYGTITSDIRGLDRAAKAMVTIGHSALEDISLKLRQLPVSKVLKVKLGAPNDLNVLDTIISLDNRPLFLDANQGWFSVEEAEAALERAGANRVIGLEQPFPKDRWDLHRVLRDRIQAPVYGDESIQGLEDLERAPEGFSGVNLKLMKCGGLDIAAQMAERAKELGLKVMLGSMSESTLGCGAMASLAGMAEVLDLDGPWLIKNDPFEGLEMVDGRLVMNGPNGHARLRQPSLLEFKPIGA